MTKANLLKIIESRIKFYQNGLNQTNIKIVMTTDIYNQLKSDYINKIATVEIDSDPMNTSETIFGIPIEINDHIATDFYITEIIEC